MKLHGWGKYPVIESCGKHFSRDGEVTELFESKDEFIPHGMGRSYGDSALNTRVAFTKRFNRILDFDPINGLLYSESGLTLSEIIDIFLPRGWFPMIVPGTRFVTLGGAISGDVHGKNHHAAGCFSQCVEHMEVLVPDKGVVKCSTKENPELFSMVCGGMGLTGVILRTCIRLRQVTSGYISENIFPAANLEEILRLFEERINDEYSVAWIDCLASGSRLGRSVLMTGTHAANGDLTAKPGMALTVPFDAPGFLLNKHTVEIFNHFYYKSNSTPVRERMTSLYKFFFPLDAIDSWNRIYGSRGFLQYQFVIPKQAGKEGLSIVLNKIASSGMASFLAVLKLFGAKNSNTLSFPMEGYTLALDFKIQDRLFPLLTELDAVVTDFGGRIYLAKDARMDRATFQKCYPEWETFRQYREKTFAVNSLNSLQSKRLGI